jgi:signal peptidase I
MKKGFTVLILVLAVFVLSGWMVLQNRHKEMESAGVQCPVSLKEMIVQGYSMYPFIEPGETVRALFGYYGCHDVSRNDVVLYRYSGNENLLIKFIRAVPGDRWRLDKNEVGYNIIVNDSIVLNSEEKLYLIADASIKMLQLYVKDYPTIPENTYLLLGDKTDGTLDSTAFGLVGKDDIMAKVEVAK